MTETQRRIKELKRSLPNMKEKVVAVAVLLALSLTMMASVSYAWYTMSFAPELAGVNTTVAANGNLEIALSGSEGTEPGASLVGDSFAAQNQTTHSANITWGNLVNLSGIYGIESLVLRPATFNPDSNVFLSSMKYGDDGRIEGTTTDFAFTTWTNVEGVDKFSVATGNAFGVRAISSVGFNESFGKSVMLLKMEQAREKLKISTDKYESIYDGETTNGRLYTEVIRDVVNVYLDYFSYKALEKKNLQSLAGIYGITGNSDITKYVPELIEIFEVFYDSILKYGEALNYLAKVQEDVLTGMGDAANKVNLGPAKTQYSTLEKKVKADLELLRNDFKNQPTVSFEEDPEVLNLINRLVHMDSSYINGGGIDNKQVSVLMNSMSEAIDIVLNLPNDAKISVLVIKGYLKDFEALHGVKRSMVLEPLKLVKANKVQGTMSTNATGSLFEDAISRTMSLDTDYLNGMEAEDTYGMVVDLWFRSNSPNGTLLALDGLVKTVTRYEERKVILTGESKSRTVYAYQRATGVMLNGIEVTEEALVFRGDADDAKSGKFEEGAYYSIYTYARAYHTETKQVQKTDADGNPVYNDNNEPVMETIVVDKTDSPITDEDVTIKKDAYEDVVGFESSNRYDGDYTITDSDEVSATQGSGSCFVFYADTPEEADAAFEMLDHLKLAFINENGDLLSQAKFDVKRVYSEPGRYTVPITITDTQATVTSEVDGSTIYGITALNRNVATRISVVLYLEGEGLENSMAFSNGSITGSLNFQFCTSEDLEALKNTDLADKIVSLSASLDKQMLDTYNGSVQYATLTAVVDGLDANSVEAIFIRKINETQGTRMEPVSLTRQGNTNTWVTDEEKCGFLLPGTYELSSLWIDGVEYKLPEKITISMAGFVVQSIGFCPSPGDEVVLTADSSVTRPVSVTFSAATQPDKVEARFRSDDGSYVTATLSQNQNGSWSGNATFTDSGVYTLRWIVVSIAKPGTNPVAYETAYYEIDGITVKPFTAYLGLRADVKINDSNSNVRFEFKKPEKYSVSVKITTDTGTDLRAMSNLELYYGARGSSLDANGLHTDLEWDGTSYVGEFNVDKPGVFSFTRVDVGADAGAEGDTITVATAAPTITAISLEPPQYVHSDKTPAVMILSHGDTEKAYYVAKIDEFPSGDVSAVFVYKYGQTEKTTVVAEDSAYRADKEPGYYYFPIPNSAEGTRNGNWVVTELRFTNVYDADGNFYGEGTEDFPAYAKYYVQEVNCAFTVLETFTVTPDTMMLNNNAAFMEPQKLMVVENGKEKYFGVSISAPGVNIPDEITISNVRLTLDHYSEGMSTYGGYSYANPNDSSKNDALDKVTTTLTYSADDKKWYVNDSAAVQLAGTYAASVSFSVGGTVNGEAVTGGTFTLGDDTVRLKVYSAKPTVKVTGVSPEDTFDVNSHASAASGGGFTLMEGVSNYFTDYYANVYIEYTGAIDVGLAAWRYYAEPTVTLTLSGMPETFTNAVMIFDHPTKEYAKTYTFTPSGLSQTNEIGHADAPELTDANPHLYFAGKQTVGTISAEVGGITYTVVLSHEVTINQQQYPPYVDLAVNDSSFTGTVPSRIYGTPNADGTFTITLPDSQTWTADGLSAVDGEFVLKSDTTDDVWTGSFNLFGNGYTKYKRNIKIYTSTSTTTTWTITKVITGWRVGNATYKPGDTVEIAGGQTITAKISETNGPATTQTQTATRTVTTFTQNGTSYREPSGTKVSSATNTDVTTYS